MTIETEPTGSENEQRPEASSHDKSQPLNLTLYIQAHIHRDVLFCEETAEELAEKGKCSIESVEKLLRGFGLKRGVFKHNQDPNLWASYRQHVAGTTRDEFLMEIAREKKKQKFRQDHGLS